MRTLNRPGMIARCVTCKQGHRFAWGVNSAHATTCCGNVLRYKEIIGVVKDTRKCDSRCTNAISAGCECECGGENHGNRWGA